MSNTGFRFDSFLSSLFACSLRNESSILCTVTGPLLDDIGDLYPSVAGRTLGNLLGQEQAGSNASAGASPGANGSSDANVSVRVLVPVVVSFPGAAPQGECEGGGIVGAWADHTVELRRRPSACV